MPTLNKKLLNKVKKHILEEPNRLVMSTWMLKGEAGNILSTHAWGEKHMEIPKCGTVGCIAGWVCILGNPNFQEALQWDVGVSAQARELLYGTASDKVFIRKPFEIFYVDQWPGEFRQRYYDAEVGVSHAQAQVERAKIVGEVIDEFKKQWDKMYAPKKKIKKDDLPARQDIQ